MGARTISEEMTLKEFGQANGLPNPALKEIFKLQNKSDIDKKLSEFGTAEQIKSLGEPQRAPYLGEHTEQVLADTLGLSSGAIGKLMDSGVAAPSDENHDYSKTRIMP